MKKEGRTNAQETKKRNIEIINNLKQTLSKPTIVEAQRTLKILEKLIERIHIFMNLDTEFVVKFNEINNPQKFRLNKTLAQELNPEVLDALVKQAKAESEFRGFQTIETQIKENEVIEEERMKEYERARKDLAYTFKTLIRMVEKHPEDIEILKNLKMNSSPNVEVSNIHDALGNYKIIMQKTLATAAEEDESHTRLIEELSLKIASLDKTKNNCERDLLKLKENRAKHAEDKKDEMDKLRGQIRDVKSHKEREMDNMNKSSKDMSEALSKDYKKEEDNLKALIAQERTKLAKMREENSKNEVKSKNEKLTSEAHLADMIMSYDTEMRNMSSTRNKLQSSFKQNSDELNNLKRHFLEIEEERNREEALIEGDRKRKHLWDLLEKKKGEAITKIKEAYKNWKSKNKKKKKKKPVKK